jgi:hypothetical protein
MKSGLDDVFIADPPATPFDEYHPLAFSFSQTSAVLVSLHEYIGAM